MVLRNARVRSVAGDLGNQLVEGDGTTDRTPFLVDLRQREKDLLDGELLSPSCSTVL
jgi:hypothetical protein